MGGAGGPNVGGGGLVGPGGGTSVEAGLVIDVVVVIL